MILLQTNGVRSGQQLRNSYHTLNHSCLNYFLFHNGLVSSNRADTLDKGILGLPHPNGHSKRCSMYTSTRLAEHGVHSA
jgi:hypothetical protein